MEHHGISLNSPHGAPLYPPHGAPLYPPHGEHLYLPHGSPPHKAETFPSHGKLLYQPNDPPLYPLHKENLYNQNENSLNQPDDKLLYPTNENPIYASHIIPLYPANGNQISPHLNPVYPPHGLPLYRPHGREPLFTPQEVFPPNPSGFLNKEENSSNEFNSFSVLINEPYQDNSKIKIHPPSNKHPKKTRNLQGQSINEKEDSPQDNLNTPNKTNNIPLDDYTKNETNAIPKEVKEDEKEVGYNCINGEILNEQNYNNEYYNYGYYGYNYDVPYQIYEPQFGEYYVDNGYNTGLYPYPNMMEKNSQNNNYQNIQLNGLDSNYSARRNSKRIKRLYTGNNYTILEVNEDNKHTYVNSENSKNQEIRKSNFNQNIGNNVEIKKEESLEKEKINIKGENKDNSVKNDINEEQLKNKDEKIDIKNLNQNQEANINEIKNKKYMKPEDPNNSLKEINYNQIPLYIEKEINRELIHENSQCLVQSNNEDNLLNINSFPIIIIKEDKIYQKFIDFLETHFKYRQFKFLPIFKKRLIIPKSDIIDDQYQEAHNLFNENIKKFADITNSSKNSIYEPQEINNIIINIKHVLNKDDLFYYQFIELWVHTVINLMAEFIQFKLKKISYFYYCDNCKFPFIYFSDNYIEELNIDSNNDLLTINIYDDLMKMININSYNNKNNENPGFIINVIYYEEEYNYMNYSFEEKINGIFIPCTNMKSFDKTMNEIHYRNIYKYDKDNNISINTKNDYMFELIISEIYIEKVFNYLINNSYFQFFKGICLLIEEKENNNINNTLLQIKKKYANYTKDLYIAQNDVLTFLDKAKEEQKYRNNKNYLTSYPIVDYINYLSKYNKLHQGASVYYNKFCINSYQIIEKVFLDFLNTIDNFKENIKFGN